MPGDFIFPQDIVDGHRFRQANDAVVQLSSATAGFNPGSPVTADFPFVHIGFNFGVRLVSGVTNRREVRNHVFDILDQASDGETWANAFPNFGQAGLPANGNGAPFTVPGVPDQNNEGLNAQIYAAQCGPGGPLKPASAGSTPVVQGEPVPAGTTLVEILAPLPGQVFAPGDVIEVHVLVDESLEPFDLAVIVPGFERLEVESFDGSSLTALLSVPVEFAGQLQIEAEVRTADGDRLVTNPIPVHVVPLDQPLDIELAQRSHRVDLTRERPVQLYLTGTYADELQRDLSSGLSGTTYATSDSTVVTVNSDGLVSAVGTGTAVVSIGHADLVDFAMFTVREQRVPLPPQDLSAEVASRSSGYRLNRNSGFFVQQLRLSNEGSVPLFGQLHAVVVGLDEDVRLVNRSGTTRQTPSPGLPFFNVALETDGLHFYPGESDILHLDFLNPERVGIEYELRIIQTTLVP